MDLSLLQEEVSPWISTAMEKENLNNVKIEVEGTSGKGDNFAGEVIFVKVTSEQKELHLVVKIGRSQSEKGKAFSEWYIREVKIYSDVFPKFRQYQLENKIELFDAIPMSFQTILNENHQVIILENLKVQGFEMHTKQNPMNMKHMELVLENYASFHAISLAMKTKNEAMFNDLTKDYKNILLGIFTNDSYFGFVRQGVRKVLNLIEGTEEKLAKVMKDYFQNELDTDMKNALMGKFDPVVITHGDCWNNNFMFKYENGDKVSPTEVKVLDWQLSTLNSPALDLAYFIYVNSSKAQLENFDKLIEFYHHHLSVNLEKYGCDANEIFPLEKLLEHWNKVAIYGVCFVFSSLEIMLAEKEDSVDLMEADEETRKEWTENLRIKVKNLDLFRERVTSVGKHYFRRINKI